MRLLLIGAGQIGSRHLQSCLKHQTKLDIVVVDQAQESLDVAKGRAEEIENEQQHLVKYFTDFSYIEDREFDYLILATGAGIRFYILSEILKSFSFKYAILEKVLFQDITSYDIAGELIKQAGVKVFVNCPIRVYPFFKMLKQKYLSASVSTSVDYVGGEWVGLACNSIHYLDLVHYLTDSNLTTIDTTYLDDGFIDSKRSGCVEFTGHLKATFENGSTIDLRSIKHSEQDSFIEIVNGDYCIKIEELSGKYEVFEDGKLIEKDSYQVVYQSDLSHKMLAQLEKTEICDLIDYNDSVDIHRPFISALLEHYNSFSEKTTTVLPIT